MEYMKTPARPDFLESINNNFNLRWGWEIVSVVYVYISEALES